MKFQIIDNNINKFYHKERKVQFFPIIEEENLPWHMIPMFHERNGSLCNFYYNRLYTPVLQFKAKGFSQGPNNTPHSQGKKYAYPRTRTKHYAEKRNVKTIRLLLSSKYVLQMDPPFLFQEYLLLLRHSSFHHCHGWLGLNTMQFSRRSSVISTSRRSFLPILIQLFEVLSLCQHRTLICIFRHIFICGMGNLS